jgi:phosphoribosyl 1,2-cyclic phosphate phosphodiesterase
MKVTFLGTSAANAFPDAFCRCSNCEQARKLGGPSLRKRSSALINDDLLIDLGPDVLSSAQIHGISLVNVKHCLQTHAHADHLDLSHLLSRSPAYGVVGAPVLNFYASKETLERAAATFIHDLADFDMMSPVTESILNIKIHQIEPFKPTEIGVYNVIAFPANHASGFGAQIYAIQSVTGCILYGTDTAAFTESTWDAIRTSGLMFDIVILDHTYGPEEQGSDHMCAHDVIEHAIRMHEDRLLKKTGRVFVTHIAHEGNPPHPELSEYAQKNGYKVAYDGLILKI